GGGSVRGQRKMAARPITSTTANSQGSLLMGFVLRRKRVKVLIWDAVTAPKVAGDFVSRAESAGA
ncbi:MAG: hypothetical protein PVG57_04960, partial [Gammaproteobacteria bacterium]